MTNPTVQVRKATKQTVSRRKGVHLNTLRVVMVDIVMPWLRNII